MLIRGLIHDVTSKISLKSHVGCDQCYAVCAFTGVYFGSVLSGLWFIPASEPHPLRWSLPEFARGLGAALGMVLIA